MSSIRATGVLFGICVLSNIHAILSERSVRSSPHGADALKYLQDDENAIKKLSKRLNKTNDQIRHLFSEDSTLHLDMGWMTDAKIIPAIFYWKTSKT
jgi:hypothetical protein